MQSRKFAARLLAAGDKDVLLLTNADAGHMRPEDLPGAVRMTYPNPHPTGRDDVLRILGDALVGRRP
jgi:hypothetical protein